MLSKKIKTQYEPLKTNEKVYFSGSSVSIFFNHILVDEITSIQYELNETIQPIYGFNSYTFDRVSRGTRIVQGQFSINFSDKGYLQNILKALCSPTEEVSFDGFPVPYYKGDNSVNNLRKLLAASAPEALESLKQDLKTQLWGSTIQNYNSTPTNPKYQFPHFYSGETDLLKGPGFDLRIEFNPDENGAGFTENLASNGFGSPSFQTHQILNEVHIFSSSQSIGNDGSTIQETYSFIAKDLNGTE